VRAGGGNRRVFASENMTNRHKFDFVRRAILPKRKSVVQFFHLFEK